MLNFPQIYFCAFDNDSFKPSTKHSSTCDWEMKQILARKLQRQFTLSASPGRDIHISGHVTNWFFYETNALQQTRWTFVFFVLYSPELKSLRYCWQIRVTHCLRPTVLDTNVNGQCDKLMTKTVTSLPHWPSNSNRQHLRRSAIQEIWLVPIKI